MSWRRAVALLGISAFSAFVLPAVIWYFLWRHPSRVDTVGANATTIGRNAPSSQFDRAEHVPAIVVDQFGYPSESAKIAVIRQPQIGFDAARLPPPSGRYALVESETRRQVLVATPSAWSNGAVDQSSGDQAYWFDFSAVTQPGRYQVVDLSNNLASPEFRIGNDIYRDVLKHAVRTFYFQRAGFEKAPAFAGTWADVASHIGPRQDRNARLFNAPSDAATERDLSGGWYDAGDYNKYTSWAAGVIITLLKAYEERPEVFTDDYGIPESGNGVPDVIDEVRWGLDWLMRMQNPDGSVLSIVGLSHASPPSAANGPSLYGNPSTSATLSAAAAYAVASRIFGQLGYNERAKNLTERARRAYTWAETNPNVLFRNSDPSSGTVGLGAGQQETDDYGRLALRLVAAVSLFELTGEQTYRQFIDANYTKLHMMEWQVVDEFEIFFEDALLRYSRLPSSSPAVARGITSTFTTSLSGSEFLGAYEARKDPYRAYIKVYTWGSNRIKAAYGNLLLSLAAVDPIRGRADRARAAALAYLNYLHGTNPLGLVYLSNMESLGAQRSVTKVYHSWFASGSNRSKPGTVHKPPPPGFLVGGPNPDYDWDSCCPNKCGDENNNAICRSENLFPPKAQPPQKAYKDFDTGWPLNAWALTENSTGYQAEYIRLLSKFVATP